MVISLCPLPQLIIKPEAHRSLLGTAVAQGLPVQWGQPTKNRSHPSNREIPNTAKSAGTKTCQRVRHGVKGLETENGTEAREPENDDCDD